MMVLKQYMMGIIMFEEPFSEELVYTQIKFDNKIVNDECLPIVFYYSDKFFPPHICYSILNFYEYYNEKNPLSLYELFYNKNIEIVLVDGISQEIIKIIDDMDYIYDICEKVWKLCSDIENTDNNDIMRLKFISYYIKNQKKENEHFIKIMTKISAYRGGENYILEELKKSLMKNQDINFCFEFADTIKNGYIYVFSSDTQFDEITLKLCLDMPFEIIK